MLGRLLNNEVLTFDEAYNLMLSIAQNELNDAQIAALITAFIMRPIQLDELAGFRKALQDLSVQVPLQMYQGVDIVGTGGDGKNTFNISTLACFVVAGTGQYVTKHGNYGASSISGASNVMELLGYKFSNDASKLQTELDKANICFLHAPLFHPALKSVAPVRKSLKMRSFFNLLGPLVNPAKPAYSLIGVSNLQTERLYNYLLQNDKSLVYTLVHALDGYDEISLTAECKVTTANSTAVYAPQDLGFEPHSQQSLFGGETTQAAADLFLNILQNKGTAAQTNAVLANAAMALLTAQQFNTYNDALQAAKESLQSGRAYQQLQTLIALQ